MFDTRRLSDAFSFRASEGAEFGSSSCGPMRGGETLLIRGFPSTDDYTLGETAALRGSLRHVAGSHVWQVFDDVRDAFEFPRDGD